MKYLLSLMFALGLAGALFAQNEVVNTVTVVDNDSLRIDRVVVQDSRPTGDFGYMKDWLSFIIRPIAR